MHMWKRRRLYRLNSYFLVLCSVLILGQLGCAVKESSHSTTISTTESETVSEAETLIDLTIPSTNITAILALCTKFSGSNESIGLLPQTKPSFRLLSTGTTPHSFKDLTLKKAINADLQTSSTLSLSADLETLTYEDTTHIFEVYNIETGSGSTPLYKDTSLRYGSATSKCLIYAETTIGDQLKTISGGDISYIDADWDLLGSTFDTVIYTRLQDKFGSHYDIDSNEQLIIVFYDIYSNFDDFSNGYLAGYFWPQDLIPVNGAYSNRKDMLYMNNLNSSFDDYLATIAHEYQHVINFSQRRLIGTDLGGMDTWLNEGLSESASHYAFETPLSTSIEQMKSSSSIRNGDYSLLNWVSAYENYVLAYTFLQYVRLQYSEDVDLYSALIQQSYSGYRSVESLLIADNTEFSSFLDILKGYHIANVVNLEDSIYGYQSERIDFNFSQLSAPTESSVSLTAGGAVYFYPNTSDLNSFVPSGNGNNIAFIRINAN
jgi:hypothetical protein